MLDFEVMAYITDSLNRRTLGPAIGSAVVGATLGIVAVVGVATLNDSPTIPASEAIPVDRALLGDPEYGSRTHP